MVTCLKKQGIKKPQSAKIEAFRPAGRAVLLLHYQAFGHEPHGRVRQYRVDAGSQRAQW
jgi:hypothetical protein